MKNESFSRRLQFAWMGIRHAARAEASFRTQLLIALGGAVVLAIIRPPPVWIALCVLSASSVLALELVNTALERALDRLHPERHEAVKIAKDCAAAAVLLASLSSLVVGALTVAVGLRWL